MLIQSGQRRGKKSIYQVHGMSHTKTLWWGRMKVAERVAVWLEYNGGVEGGRKWSW